MYNYYDPYLYNQQMLPGFADGGDVDVLYPIAAQNYQQAMQSYQNQQAQAQSQARNAQMNQQRQLRQQQRQAPVELRAASDAQQRNTSEGARYQQMLERMLARRLQEQESQPRMSKEEKMLRALSGFMRGYQMAGMRPGQSGLSSGIVGLQEEANKIKEQENERVKKRYNTEDKLLDYYHKLAQIEKDKEKHQDIQAEKALYRDAVQKRHEDSMAGIERRHEDSMKGIQKRHEDNMKNKKPTDNLVKLYKEKANLEKQARNMAAQLVDDDTSLTGTPTQEKLKIIKDLTNQILMEDESLSENYNFIKNKIEAELKKNNQHE